MKPPFIEEPLKKISTKTDLDNLLSTAANPGKTIENCEISVDCSGRSFEGFIISNTLFNRFSVDSRGKKEMFQVIFRDAVLKNVGFPQSRFVRCDFDGATLERVDFLFCEFSYCRFKKSKGKMLDFRYSSFEDSSLSEAEFRYGDFYMAAFKGTTTFFRCRLSLCSITAATFENDCLTMDNLMDKDKKNVYLIQDSFCDYQEFSTAEGWEKYNPCGGKTHRNPYDDCEDKNATSCFLAGEAMQEYRKLSGLYSGKGLHRDSNRAYRMSKRKELEYHWRKAWRYIRKLDTDLDSNAFKEFGKCIGPFLAKAFGYGYQWQVVTLWFLILVLGFGAVYHSTSPGSAYIDSLQQSLNNSMGPYQGFLETVHNFIGSVEPTVGVLLIGFLGFIIANRIRNNG